MKSSTAYGKRFVIMATSTADQLQLMNSSFPVPEVWMNASIAMEDVTVRLLLRSHDGELELYLTMFYLISVLLIILSREYWGHELDMHL